MSIQLTKKTEPPPPFEGTGLEKRLFFAIKIPVFKKIDKRIKY